MEHAIHRRSPGLVPLGVAGDARLVRLAARGDEAAFAAIFRRYHQPLYRYCRAITGNGEDAADALQNTMVKAMRALPGEQRSIELKPWLFRVAHNEAVSLLRRRHPQSQLEEAADTAVDGPEAGASAREEIRELMSDLRDLPPRQQGVVILRELNGLSYAEIGTVFGTTDSAAKRAAHDGRMALQEFARGRAMDCDSVPRAISDGDRQLLSGRRIRGHLRSCAECADFKRALEARRTNLAAMAPALPATAALALMQKLFGAGGGSAGWRLARPHGCRGEADGRRGRDEGRRGRGSRRGRSRRGARWGPDREGGLGRTRPRGRQCRVPERSPRAGCRQRPRRERRCEGRRGRDHDGAASHVLGEASGGRFPRGEGQAPPCGCEGTPGPSRRQAKADREANRARRTPGRATRPAKGPRRAAGTRARTRGGRAHHACHAHDASAQARFALEARAHARCPALGRRSPTPRI